MRGAAALAGLALLAGCAAIPRGRTAGGPGGPGGPDLSGLLAFTDPHRCAAGPTLSHLLATLLRDTTRVPVEYGPVEVPARFRPYVGPARLARRRDAWEASATVRGTWLGLPVAAVVSRGYDGGDGAGFGILFHAPARAVAAAARRAGFPVVPPGPLAPRPEWQVTVGPAGPGTAALECTVNG